jgi:hypothetical protein
MNTSRTLARRRVAQLISHHVPVRDLGNHGHARACVRVGVGGGRLDGAPCFEVRGGGVDEFLVVCRVALVRVVAHELVVVEEEVGLPDGGRLA